MPAPKVSTLSGGLHCILNNHSDLLFLIVKMSDLSDLDENEAEVVAKAKADLAKDENSFESELAKYVDENVIGQKTTFRGPFGRKRVVYCDNSTTGDMWRHHL